MRTPNTQNATWAGLQGKSLALVVGEAHCIQTWGDDFRISFAEIGNFRSVLPQHVSVTADSNSNENHIRYYCRETGTTKSKDDSLVS